MANLDIHLFPCLDDNYGVLIHDSETGATASIDAPEEGPILKALEEAGWSLTQILVTHHHADHTQAIAPLKERFGCGVTGPAGEAQKIPTLDRTVSEGDSVTVGGFSFNVIETPGHTLGHITYHCPEARLAFAADTLFPLGCGRVFEGTMAQMWDSLLKLRALPDDTVVYSGHEYTMGNAKFALSVDPDNAALQARMAETEAKRAAGESTVPTTIGAEKAANPFLRADDTTLAANVGLSGADSAEVFGEVRVRKDNF